MLGDVSRVLNRLFGGRPGESLCARWTRTRGSDCLPCRLVGFVLRDRLHCFNQYVHEIKERTGCAKSQN